MYNFETEVNINVVGNGIDISGSGRAKVKWVMTLEAAEDGVKCFGLYVPKQQVDVTLTCYDSDTDEEYEVERSLDLNNVMIDEMESVGNFQHLHLIPTELEVHGNTFELRF